MDNQHRKIKGYRELSEYEISLMNRIKEKGAEILALQAEIETHCLNQSTAEDADELSRWIKADPMRWLAIGKTDIETGVMALVRAVAQPA